MSKLLYSYEEINNKISEFSDVLNQKKEQLYIIVVLNGAMRLADNLISKLNNLYEVDFIRIKSYNNNKQSDLNILKKWETDLKGKNVLILEDIIDSGKTMQKIISLIKNENPNKITLYSLFVRTQIKENFKDVDFYYGFELNNDYYIYGFGLDDNGFKRGLNDVWII